MSSLARRRPKASCNTWWHEAGRTSRVVDPETFFRRFLKTEEAEFKAAADADQNVMLLSLWPRRLRAMEPVFPWTMIQVAQPAQPLPAQRCRPVYILWPRQLSDPENPSEIERILMDDEKPNVGEFNQQAFDGRLRIHTEYKKAWMALAFLTVPNEKQVVFSGWDSIHSGRDFAGRG
jgi:hypothetical protein